MGLPLFKRMLPGVQKQMWETYRCCGCHAAAEAIGVSRESVLHWVQEVGGIAPRPARLEESLARLGYSDRVHIAVGLSLGQSLRSIGRRLGRPVCTISREIGRNGRPGRAYSAEHAQRRARESAARPQALKLGVDSTHPNLRRRVVDELAAGRSPHQISQRLRAESPPRPDGGGAGGGPVGHSGTVAAETIYRALYLQARGGLKREVEAVLKARRAAGQSATQAGALRSGQTVRKPRAARRGTGQGQIPDMITIAERPATTDTDGNWLPGHHEGDLILGKGCKSAIGTIVERSTGYLWLLHLPDGHTAHHVRVAITAQLTGWPDLLRQSLTWDRGKEMSQHKQISIDTGLKVYFANPHSPWQRPGNENVNGLLRQYFPKGTDLSIHSAAELQRVADQMNDRPRARFGYAKPIELMTELVLR